MKKLSKSFRSGTKLSILSKLLVKQFLEQIKLFGLATVILAAFSTNPVNLNAQELKQSIENASKIYVVPITGKYYYVTECVPNEPDESLPVYVPDSEYEIGDTIRIEMSPYYANVKIFGIIPNEVIDNINKTILENCKQRFGDDKVMLWPEGQFMIEKWGEMIYDEKGVDCDFYVMPDLTILSQFTNLENATGVNQTPNLVALNYKGESISCAIILDCTIHTLKIGLFQKVKPGKPGKKIVSATRMYMFFKSSVGGRSLVERIPIGYDNEEEMLKKIHEIMPGICLKSTDLFEVNTKDFVDKFFDEIDEKLAK
ncbi:hypothetical protein ACFLRQ_01265 [Bacteroidota bacterium]